MNLKRLRGIATVAFITIAAALFAGCMNSMAGSVDGGSETRMATLSLSATGIPNDYAEQFAETLANPAVVSSRSITPNDPYDIGKGTGQSAGLTFKLSGTSETGKRYSETQVYLKPGEVADSYTFYLNNAEPYNPVVLDSMSWNLKLVAYKGDDAVLQGFCSVDLRTGSGTAKFTMGTAGLSTEGSVYIHGTFVDTDDAAASYSMGIYRKDTGEVLDAALLKKGSCQTDGTAESFSFGESSTPINVAPGTYLYTMIFYAGDNCTGNVVGSFTDTLVVDPGNALERTLNIDVIGKKPEKPTDLKAYLVNGTEGENGSPTYNVKVEWGKSAYANNYELQVLEYIGSYDTTGSWGSLEIAYDTTSNEIDVATAANWKATTYGMKSMNASIEDFAGSDVYGTDDGTSSMMYGDTSCSLVLETGKLYEIRLRGRNYFGASEFAERIKSDNVAAATPAKALTGFDIADGNDNPVRINRLLVTYHLNGGTFGYSSNDGVSFTKTDTYSEYKSWTTSIATALPTDDSSGADNTYQISIGSSRLESWLFEKGEGLQVAGDSTKTPINSATANASKEKVTDFTYKNLTVFASYGNKVTGDISMGATLKDIDPSHISVVYDGGVNATGINETSLIGDGSDEVPVTLKKYTVQKLDDNSNANTVKIELNLTTNPNLYSDVSFTLIDARGNKKTLPLADGSLGTCKIDLSDYTTGPMQIMVSAVTNKMATVSQTLLFDVQ